MLIEETLKALVLEGKTYIRDIKGTEYDLLLSRIVKIDTEENRKFKYNNLIKKYKGTSKPKPSTLKDRIHKQGQKKVQEIKKAYDVLLADNPIEIFQQPKEITAKEQLVLIQSRLIKDSLTEQERKQLKEKALILENIIKEEYIANKEQTINNDIKYQILSAISNIESTKREDLKTFNQIIEETKDKIEITNTIIEDARTQDEKLKAINVFKELQNQRIKTEELKMKIKERGVSTLNNLANTITTLNQNNVNLALNQKEVSDLNNEAIEELDKIMNI